MTIQVQTSSHRLGEYQYRKFREHGAVLILMLSIYFYEYCAQCWTAISEGAVVEQFVIPFQFWAYTTNMAF